LATIQLIIKSRTGKSAIQIPKSKIRGPGLPFYLIYTIYTKS